MTRCVGDVVEAWCRRIGLGRYAFRLQLNANDGTSQFARDATFCPQEGNSGQGWSFLSWNHPSRYIRRYDYNIYAASNGGSGSFDALSNFVDDSTWMVASPWS